MQRIGWGRRIAAMSMCVVALAAAAGTAAPVSAATACPTGWGSLPKVKPGMTRSTIASVRAGRHTCFDRFVVEIAGYRGGFDGRYVATVLDQGGKPVTLRGGAFIELTVRAPAYDRHGNPTFPTPSGDLVSVTGYDAFRQIRYAGSFEGVTSFGIGLRARLPFKVYTVTDSPAHCRIVIDVAHAW